jgi:DNA transformation protein
VNDGFRDFALEQLARIAPAVRSRRMFGGVGIYSGDAFFALIDADVLYLKADAKTRDEFVAAGMQPFRPFGDDTPSLQYYAIAGDLLEDTEALAPWVEKALAAARRKRRPR